MVQKRERNCCHTESEDKCRNKFLKWGRRDGAIALKNSDWFLIGGGRANRKPRNGADHSCAPNKKVDSGKQPKQKKFLWGALRQERSRYYICLVGFVFGVFPSRVWRDGSHSPLPWPLVLFPQVAERRQPTWQPGRVLNWPPLPDLPRARGWGGRGNFTKSAQ